MGTSLLSWSGNLNKAFHQIPANRPEVRAVRDEIPSTLDDFDTYLEKQMNL